ncbi:MAG: ankyrin repeat domain-containing protein [Elusimicrobiaceae bacterium]|nr:ankyrin repeat domain-containing protein [Elusimicrobiaceae bacterium]
MKKFLSFLIFLVKTILVLFLIGIILFLLLIFGVEIHDFYYKHFSTAAKIKAYLKANDFEKLKKLNLKEGINAYYNHYTPLYYAVKANNTEAVKYFIEQGADGNLPYYKCHAPGIFILDCPLGDFPSVVSIALEKDKNPEIIKILIENGADINKEIYLHMASKAKRIDIVKKQLSAGVKDDFCSAIIREDLEATKKLIDEGADFKNPYCNFATSPLRYAEKIGNKEIIELLKSAGAK